MEFKLSNIIITIEEKAKIDKQIRSFHLYIMKNLPKCNSTIEASKKKKHFSWLSSTIMVVVDQNYNQVASDCLMGRPRLFYCDDHGSKEK